MAKFKMSGTFKGKRRSAEIDADSEGEAVQKITSKFAGFTVDKVVRVEPEPEPPPEPVEAEEIVGAVKEPEPEVAAEPVPPFVAEANMLIYGVTAVGVLGVVMGLLFALGASSAPIDVDNPNGTTNTVLMIGGYLFVWVIGLFIVSFAIRFMREVVSLQAQILSKLDR